MLHPVLADFHMHTAHSPDSDAPMVSMCESAAASGLYAAAITDHIEIPAFYTDGYDQTLKASYKEAETLLPRFAGRLRIARGVELGEPMQDLATAEKVLDMYDFDFVLGSVHNLMNDKDFFEYDYRGNDMLPLIDRYFDEELAMAEWGRFHSLAHLTYPFRYFPKDICPPDYSLWQTVIDAILRTITKKGIALEINTSGLRQAVGKTLPDLPLIRRFHELGGERITLGSDAHFPEHVAGNILDGLRIAKQAGFSSYTVFFNGEAETVPIEA